MGRNDHEYNTRLGVFDWLVGSPQPGMNYDARWARDMAAMCLRGLQWTAPTGALFLAQGYGWLPLASGAMMGPVYELGYQLAVPPTEFWTQVASACVCGRPAPFGRSVMYAGPCCGGGALGVLDMVHATADGVCVDVCVTRAPSCPARAQFAVHRGKLRQVISWPALVAAHAFMTALDVVFAVSCVAYNGVQQSDMLNADQTTLGMLVSTAVMVLAHGAFGLKSRCRRGHAGASAEGADADACCFGGLTVGSPAAALMANVLVPLLGGGEGAGTGGRLRVESDAASPAHGCLCMAAPSGETRGTALRVCYCAIAVVLVHWIAALVALVVYDAAVNTRAPV